MIDAADTPAKIARILGPTFAAFDDTGQRIIHGEASWSKEAYGRLKSEMPEHAR
jgi:hypothetical protein